MPGLRQRIEKMISIFQNHRCPKNKSCGLCLKIEGFDYSLTELEKTIAEIKERKELIETWKDTRDYVSCASAIYELRKVLKALDNQEGLNPKEKKLREKLMMENKALDSEEGKKPNRRTE